MKKECSMKETEVGGGENLIQTEKLRETLMEAMSNLVTNNTIQKAYERDFCPIPDWCYFLKPQPHQYTITLVIESPSYRDKMCL